MRASSKLALTILALAIPAGCTLSRTEEPPSSAPAISTQPRIETSSANDDTASQSLPFKGRLVDGNPNELPPMVARSLDAGSPVTFAYSEELTHDDYHIPLIISALDPVTYVGAPLGDFGVTAFATLTIFDHDRVIGDYTAKTHVSRSYNLYHEPTHHEVEEAARAAVRQKINTQLAQDSQRLGKALERDGGAGAKAAKPGIPRTPDQW